MSIQSIVEMALARGYLSPNSEAMLDQVSGSNRALEAEEYEALVALNRAVASGRVLVPERKHCINVMEELVWEVVVEAFASHSIEGESAPDMGDVAAYALNRLSPLYATTEEGAQYQREHASRERMTEIGQRVAEAMERGVRQPDYHPERKPLGRSAGQVTIARLVGESLGQVPRVT